MNRKPLKRIIPLLLLSLLLMGFTCNDANLARYKKYISGYSKYVPPQHSNCGEYEQSMSDNKTWELIWSDEFDYSGRPDENKWSYDVGYGKWGNNELEYYSERAENVRVANGTLIIEARADGFGMKYSSGRLTTRKKEELTYGKIDVKAKMPVGRGVWPAIWLKPVKNLYGDWPRSGEIDMVEIVGFNPCWAHFSIHTERYNHSIRTQKSTYTELEAPYDNYHVYSLEWDLDQITILVDGIVYLTYERSGSKDATVWPFDQDFYLIFNIAIGGTWGGVFGVDRSIFPQQMKVDYVRIYQKRNMPINTKKEREGSNTIKMTFSR